jgi:integrase/recombinase XerD
VFTLEECGRLVASCGTTRDRALVLVLWGTGARISEVCELEWKDVNDRTLRVLGKGSKRYPGGRERFVVLPPRAWAALMRLKLECGGFAGETRVFGIKRRGAYKLLRRIAERAGVGGVHPHAFRHTCATMLVQSGQDIRWVQAYLGHASIRSTQLYTHIAIEGLHEVAKNHPMEG